jgi:hypothetical protein
MSGRALVGAVTPNDPYVTALVEAAHRAGFDAGRADATTVASDAERQEAYDTGYTDGCAAVREEVQTRLVAILRLRRSWPSRSQAARNDRRDRR